MKAEIITIGTEVLMGDITNTNAKNISKICSENGHYVYYTTVVGDNFDRACEVLELAKKRSDLIIIGGGLGPTEDDITRSVVAKVFNLNLIYDKEIERHMLDFYKTDKLVNICYRQALKFQGSKFLKNPYGSACGYRIDIDNKVVLVLPGPPSECLPMLKKEIKNVPSKEKKLFSKTLKLINICEHDIAYKLSDIIKKQSNPTLALYCGFMDVRIRITANAYDEKEANSMINPIVKMIEKKFGKNIYAYSEKEGIEDALVNLLKDKGYKISLAESCTGGMIASQIINVSGASDVIENSFITYSPNAKSEILNIDKDLLAEFGVYSSFTATSMLKGLSQITDAQCLISITGVSDIDDEIAGITYIGTCVNNEYKIKKYQLHGNCRNENRSMATRVALIQLYNQILGLVNTYVENETM